MRTTQSLNGIWRFQPDPGGEGSTFEFFSGTFDDSRWREAPVPGCFEHGCPGLDFCELQCWYRRRLSAPEVPDGHRVWLRFEGVNYRATVWLNGHELGRNVDPFLPFEYDITDQLSQECNSLVVLVDNRHHPGDVPGNHVGWRGFGGILRDVTLEVRPSLSVSSIACTAPACGEFSADISLANLSDTDTDAALQIRIEGPDGEHVTEITEGAVTVPAGGIANATLSDTIDPVVNWTPQTPALYRVTVSVLQGDVVRDTAEHRIGFRTIETTADGLLLNGEELYLTGYNRHEDSPRTDMAQDLETARRDLEQMKEAGATMVRLCHYPHHPGELDLCDELGLLVFAEVPLYFWNDDEDGRENNPARVEATKRQLTRMIARDRNHPSVIFWSVSNETQDNEEGVAASNRELITFARGLDHTRLCVHVSDKWEQHPNFAADDVICINNYPTNWYRLAQHQPHLDQRVVTEHWRTHLAALHERYPDKPVLVTEFGFCSLPNTFGQAYAEDTHARVIETEFAGMDAPWVCGALIWCWADHPWPAGRFNSGTSTSPYGVLTRSRHRKAPYDTARKMFRTRQGMPDPPRTPDPDSTNVVMIREHMRDIPQVAFPDGYGVRGMRREDIALWTDIQRDAEEFLTIGDNLFLGQFGDDLESIGHRCFIVTDPKGRGIGTISAWRSRNWRGKEWGRIHWVALRPSYQGKGLGKAMLTFAMNELAQYHDRVYLDTDLKRIPAISLYLKYGFQPDRSTPEGERVWKRWEGN